MRNKLIIKVVAIALALCCCFALFGACASSEEYNKGSATVTLVIDTTLAEGGEVKEYKNIKTKAKMLVTLMRDLQDDKQLTYVGTGEKETFFVTEINGINASKAGQSGFYGIYTDATDYYNTTWGTAKYNDKDFSSSIAGVAMLPIQDGKTYIIKLSVY